jgi:serine/threonine protein kinase
LHGHFHREAQLLAQMNHPSVAGIYGVEEPNGQYAPVMELAEGSTIAID